MYYTITTYQFASIVQARHLLTTNCRLVKLAIISIPDGFIQVLPVLSLGGADNLTELTWIARTDLLNTMFCSLTKGIPYISLTHV